MWVRAFVQAAFGVVLLGVVRHVATETVPPSPLMPNVPGKPIHVECCNAEGKPTGAIIPPPLISNTPIPGIDPIVINGLCVFLGLFFCYQALERTVAWRQRKKKVADGTGYPDHWSPYNASSLLCKSYGYSTSWNHGMKLAILARIFCISFFLMFFSFLGAFRRNFAAS